MRSCACPYPETGSHFQATCVLVHIPYPETGSRFRGTCFFAHVLIPKPVPTFGGHALPCPLAEQDLLRFLVVAKLAPVLPAHRHAALDGRTRHDRLEPALQIGELV